MNLGDMPLKIITGQKLKIHSVLIIGLVLSGLFILPAQAKSSVIDLDLGGEGAVPWEIKDIKPGDSGIKTIELHNKGSGDGFVTIWISEINETDYGGDGASLDNYLLLNLSGERMETNISMPSTIHEFPQNASDPKYINITRLDSGEVISLDWEWEFQMKETPQNEAQGDQLSFNIHFMLEELPSSEGDRHKSHDDGDQVLNIIKPEDSTELTIPKKTDTEEPFFENVSRDVKNNDRDKKENYNLFAMLSLIFPGLITKENYNLFAILLLIFMGLVIIARKKARKK